MYDSPGIVKLVALVLEAGFRPALVMNAVGVCSLDTLLKQKPNDEYFLKTFDKPLRFTPPFFWFSFLPR